MRIDILVDKNNECDKIVGTYKMYAFTLPPQSSS